MIVIKKKIDSQNTKCLSIAQAFWLRLIGLMLFFSLSLSVAEAQRPQSFPGSGRGGGGASTGPRELDEPEAPDTIPVNYFFAENPNLEIPFSDSLLHQYFHQYDPTRQGDIDYANLGLFGSPYQPLIYEAAQRRGFDVGLHQYDIYFKPALQLPFFTLGQPFTKLYYTQGATQSDANIGAQFSRNFANGMNFSLDYSRISELGSAEQYPNQNTRLTSISMGMWYHSNSGKYDGFFSYAANTAEQEENGGIEVEPILNEEFGDIAASQVFLDDAQRRQAHRELAYTHYYKFGGQQDSLKGITRAYTLSHQLLYKSSVYKFYDNTPIPDSSFYQQFWVDLRGIRHYIEHKKIENTFKLATFKLDKDSPSKDQRDLLEVGLTHSLNILKQEPIDSNINNLFAFGNWRLKLSDRLLFKAYGHLGLWDNAGDFKVQGDLTLDFKKIGRLSVSAMNQLYSPNLLQESFYVSQRQIWNNDFNKTLESQLVATYSLPQFNFEVTGAYHLVNNYIYFDSLATPRQTGVPISILRLTVKKNFKLGPFHLDNVISLQEVSEDVIRLPSLYTKHSLYYAGKWFKVLNVRLGADLRYSDQFFSNYYHPLVGQFILQDRQQIGAYPSVDAFFSMRVTSFRAFFKWENITRLVRQDDLFYPSSFYLYPLNGIRLGIYWTLRG